MPQTIMSNEKVDGNKKLKKKHFKILLIKLFPGVRSIYQHVNFIISGPYVQIILVGLDMAIMLYIKCKTPEDDDDFKTNKT